MKVNAKGQITIPKHLRDALGLSAGTEVELARKRNTIEVRKVITRALRSEKMDERMRGRGNVDMTTDEIMALTRGE